MPLKEEQIAKLLISKGMVTQSQVDRAKEEAKRTGLAFERALERLGFITEEDIVGILAESMGVLYIKPDDYLIDSEVVGLVNEQLARRYKCVPLFKIGNTLTLAMANPKDIIAIDEIRMKSKVNMVEPVYATEKSILKAIDQYYGASDSVEDLIKSIDTTKIPIDASEEAELKVLAKEAEQAPVVRLVNMLLMQAIKDKASDIHIEPEEDKVRIRFRIDGILHEISTSPKHLQSVVASRIKILSKLDIAESRKPQDGRIQLKMQNKKLDLRVSTFPTVHGENIVLRLLDQSNLILDLKDLGFGDKELEEFNHLIKVPYGFLLVTGPTGSGKTTTLYSALSTINSLKLNIITIEDPVEYELPLIRQTQVNPKAGLTFANGLRAMLRQDPDIVMVGEVRDKETADVAIQASLTGHLVFSTLHTNDASGALVRLMDLGVEPFLISTAVIGILAQRLVRVICRECKQPYHPPVELLRELRIEEGSTFYRGAGCKVCKNTGYSGRIGIFELLIVTEEMKRLLVGRASSVDIKTLAQKQGMRTLRQEGIEKARQGITTLEEVLRVTDVK